MPATMMTHLKSADRTIIAQPCASMPAAGPCCRPATRSQQRLCRAARQPFSGTDAVGFGIAKHMHHRGSVMARGFGEDAWAAWGDLASLVASSSGSGGKTPYDDLADKLGARLFCDMNGWHVYLKDLNGVKGLKMHQVLAQALGKQLPGSDQPAEQLLSEMLKVTPVSLGGGKTTVALLDLVDAAAVQEAARVLEDYRKHSSESN